MKRGQEQLFVDNRRMKLVRMINSHVFRQSEIVAAGSARSLDRLVAASRKRQRKQSQYQGRSPPPIARKPLQGDGE